MQSTNKYLSIIKDKQQGKIANLIKSKVETLFSLTDPSSIMQKYPLETTCGFFCAGLSTTFKHPLISNDSNLNFSENDGISVGNSFRQIVESALLTLATKYLTEKIDTDSSNETKLYN